MGHDHDHGHDDHGHQNYPGPDTHQSGWVMWLTIGACITFCTVVLTAGAL